MQIKNSGETHRSIGKRKTKYACIVDADESTRPRAEGVVHISHQDHITAKGMNSMTHYSLVSDASSVQNSRCKSGGGEKCEKLKKIPAWQLTEVRNKKDVIDEALNNGRKVHFATLMDLCHLENSELKPRYQKY